MQEFTIKLNTDDINYLSKVLGKEPFSEVAPIINRIDTQIARQVEDGERHTQNKEGASA